MQMRLGASLTSMRLASAESGSRVIVLSSIAFLLSAAMQLATAWIQSTAQSKACQCDSAGGSTSAKETLQIPGASIVEPSKSFEDEYTWLSSDYPPSLPLDLGPPVQMTIEDSPHYSVSAPLSSHEWHSIYPGRNLGFVRLGPQNRFFGISLYHQMHCIDTLREGLAKKDNGSRHAHHTGTRDETVKGNRAPHDHAHDIAHWSHCLNYLRQTVLCAADLTLEPEIEEGSQNVGEGLYVTHVCRDWSKVHRFVDDNWEQWWAEQTALFNVTKPAATTKTGSQGPSETRTLD